MKLQQLSFWKRMPLSYRIRVWIADRCHALYIFVHPDQPLQELINFEESELDEFDDETWKVLPDSFDESEYDCYPTLEEVLK